ncbi:phage distal tail protein [Paenibacillus sp. FSL K6-2859]|uniref:phage distal tail protein n=1 Tax=Paenibacillus sp. FSL K6-2859 TaxID=2921482 RepID=UPI0030F56A35
MSFNRAPFNRPYVIRTYFNVTIESATEPRARLNADFAVGIVFDTATKFDGAPTRDIPSAATFTSATEMLTQMIRERLNSASIRSATQFNAKVRYMHVDKLGFTGNFAPGDKLVIDTKKQTITLNGVNAIHMLDGDFFELGLGLNEVTYADNEATRSVLTRITHRDRYLY